MCSCHSCQLGAYGQAACQHARSATPAHDHADTASVCATSAHLCASAFAAAMSSFLMSLSSCHITLAYVISVKRDGKRSKRDSMKRDSMASNDVPKVLLILVSCVLLVASSVDASKVMRIAPYCMHTDHVTCELCTETLSPCFFHLSSSRFCIPSRSVLVTYRVPQDQNIG
jgi:hypothetical protein